MKTVEEFYDQIFPMAQHIVEVLGQEHAPILLALSNDGAVGAIPQIMMGQVDKDTLAGAHKWLAMDSGIACAALVMEAWAVSVKESDAKETLGASLADHPDRKEVILFNFLTKTRQAIATCRIERRDDGTSVLNKGPLEWADSTLMGGRFVRESDTTRQ